MDNGLTRTIGLAAITALIATFVARADGTPIHQASGTIAVDSGAKLDAGVAPHWITDAAVLALFGVINAKQVAAANVELSAWHSDSVRALAAAISHDHADLARLADSVARLIHITPVAPALAAPLAAALQARTDSITEHRGTTLDRAFVDEQVSSERMITDYLGQLAAAADRPELKDLLGNAAGRVATRLQRAMAMQAAFVQKDSVAADSVGRRATRRGQ